MRRTIRRDTMYAAVRQWSNASALTDALMQRQSDVEQLLRGVPGFVSYYGLRDGASYTSITVCQDRAGAEESNRIAGQWVRENLSGVSLAAPQMSGGDRKRSCRARVKLVG